MGALILALTASPAEAAAQAVPSISAESASLTARAAEAARLRRWSDVQALATAAKDPLTRSLIAWLYLTDPDTKPGFGELSSFLAAHPDWPGRTILFQKAEKAMPPNLAPDEVIGWFGGRTPATGEGKIRLGEAYIAQGRRADGEVLIRTGYIEGDFDAAREREIATKYHALVQGPVSAARANRLLWDRRIGEAQQLITQMDSENAQLVRARLTLLTSPSQRHAVVSALPEKLRSDSGLIFEQVRALRQQNDTRTAVSLTLSVSAPTAAEKWWAQRHALAREALALGLYGDAYQIAKQHGLSSGSDFADAEWLAGFIALRFLKTPDTALVHFQNLMAGVNFPVSKARAAYWSGRAAEAAGRLAEAAQFYQRAAGYPTTYYGQLAATRLDKSKALIDLPVHAPMPSTAKASFETSEIVRATRLAATTRYDPLVKPFFSALAERASTPEEFLLAGTLARDAGYPNQALRIAKRALQQDIVLTSLAYPVISVPERLPSGKMPEPALVLGISRQESEFDPHALSPAGATGLMQLLPSTAKIVAKQHKIPFDAKKLTDPVYNAKLGAAYLGGLIDDFGGSYPLAIAGYNAGPSRSRQWILANGDPRDPKVDAIDWVELIPFNETRNYVQRVLENTQVYRQRLAGTKVAIRIDDDLHGKRLGTAQAALPPLPQTAPVTDKDDQPTGAVAVPTPKPPAPPQPPSAADIPAPTPKPDAPQESVASPTPVAPARDAPIATPFNAGQPETVTATKECMRQALAADGSIQCLEQ